MQQKKIEATRDKSFRCETQKGFVFMRFNVLALTHEGTKYIGRNPTQKKTVEV